MRDDLKTIALGILAPLVVIFALKFAIRVTLDFITFMQTWIIQLAEIIF